LVPLVRSTPGVAAAQGGVNGYALVIGKDGKAVEGQAPTLAVSWGPIPRFAKSFNVKHGTRPTQPNEVGLDETTASKAKVGVGDRYEAITQKDQAKETADNIKQGLSFFNTFLLIFALVALFVGAFIIYNTFSIIVAQRARELGLLKAVGASGRQVTWSVAVE